MNKKISKKLQRKPLPIELVYRQVELAPNAINGLDRAFDILFDEVLRRRELRGKRYPHNDIDNNRQLRT
jgi:hypothetical protein